MGAWDIGPFDNDDAADWLYQLEESDDTSVIAAALDSVTEVGDDYLEAPDCSCALAAAEIVAALHGHPMAGLSDEAKAWLEKNRGLDVSELVEEAVAAVQRVRTNSELKELWEESDELPKWEASLDDVTRRLQAPAKK